MCLCCVWLWINHTNWIVPESGCARLYSVVIICLYYIIGSLSWNRLHNFLSLDTQQVEKGQIQCAQNCVGDSLCFWQYLSVRVMASEVLCLHLTEIMRIHLSLPTYRCLPIAAHLSLSTYRCLPIAAYLSLPTYRCLPIAAYLSLPTYRCLPIAEHCFHDYCILVYREMRCRLLAILTLGEKWVLLWSGALILTRLRCSMLRVPNLVATNLYRLY